jgi:hypothetical protein
MRLESGYCATQDWVLCHVSPRIGYCVTCHPGSGEALAHELIQGHAYLVNVPKKPQDSVALYPHRLRVDHSSVRKLQEVIATVEALKQQRLMEADG